MHHVLVIGAGKIGSLITFLLTESKQYFVYLADVTLTNPHIKKCQQQVNCKVVRLDAKDAKGIADFLQKNSVEAIISSLPYFCNADIANIAAQHHLHYFDLTEDVKTTHLIEKLAEKNEHAFVPQCGLAPGFISIIANDLMRHFPTLDTVKMRVGALPTHISNALQYSLTWSTDGLINEYGNICEAIENGERVELQPLEDLEEIKIDGLTYEAFNTSGGLGSLVQTYAGKVKQMSYKTIRYPGHCAKIKFLMNDMQLNADRETLKRILEHALPKTYQDVVLVYVSVMGFQQEQFIEECYVKKFYPQTIGAVDWSAIQFTTASGLCAVVDMVLSHPEKYHGLVRQEQFSYAELIQNQFGRAFDI